ncbi:hypothetical protein [Stenotrophomonas sp.]|uniref:hypothetical protein n=1 Tax=Stenotrophomonas sp. TaxID=69392 RepID=UPI0028A780B7|nr:hypothetical protein [Stenotrophomonas sp.]
MTTATVQNRVELLDRMYEAGVRIGEILHLVGMAADTESPAGPFAEFIETELASTDGACQPIFRQWPEFKAALQSFERAFLDTKNELGRRHAETMFREEVAAHLLRYCPTPFIVKIEWQIADCVSTGERFPLGTWRMGWGYYGSEWILAATIDEAICEAIRRADGQRLERWNARANDVEGRA